MPHPLPRRVFTQEEYLAIELPAAHKSQFVAGEIFAAQGEQPWHVEVVGGIVASLHRRLHARKDCHFYASLMRVRVESAELLTYPDVVALCGEPRFERFDDSVNLLNPQVIFEVPSPITESFDRGDKFRRYRQLDSLTDYVLVSSERVRVEHHHLRPNGIWLCEEYTNAKSRFRLVSLACELPLAEIYEGVTFPDPADR